MFNYARWISMHIQDLLSLPIKCPQHDQEFERGNFVVQISGRHFSQIYYNQANKQSNKTITSIKGPIDFVNCAIVNWLVTEKMGDCRIWNCQIFRASWEQDAQSYQQKNDTHYYEDNLTRDAMLRKDYTTVIGRLLPINPFLQDSFIKLVQHL